MHAWNGLLINDPTKTVFSRLELIILLMKDASNSTSSHGSHKATHAISRYDKNSWFVFFMTITITRSCLNLILQYHLLQFESILFECFCFLLLLLSTSTVSTRFMRPQTALRWLQRFATFSSSSPILSTATFTLLNHHLQFHH